jgi:hypothetical protein
MDGVRDLAQPGNSGTNDLAKSCQDFRAGTG